jgi:hypothetical protein
MTTSKTIAGLIGAALVDVEDFPVLHMRSLRKSATSGRLRLFFLGGNLPGSLGKRFFRPKRRRSHSKKKGPPA